ncbi:hemolysin family protein [Gemmatimonadota bacterium]
MTGWLLLLGGIGMGAVGMTTVVACMTANQVELYRWITGRESGAKAARALLAAPSRIVGSALGIAASGTVLAGIGLRALMDGLGPVTLAVAIVFLVVPFAATVFYSLPGAVGRRWPESTIEALVPWASRLAPLFAPVLPQGSSVRPRADLTSQRPEQSAAEPGGSDELTLVSGVLAFTERHVREVMTPRTEVVAIADNAPLEDVCRLFADSGFSRLPLFNDSLDEIVGMYYAFDLLKLPPGGQLPVRPVTLVPTTRPCADLLFEMQRDRRQVAVVLDEFGGTAGIVTMNDLLTDLVEETFETAEVQPTESASQPSVLEVEGTAELADVALHFSTSLPGDAETVGGLLSSVLGRIPKPGERFELADLEFDVVAATATRVERVTVRRGTVPVTRLDSAGRQ